MVCLLPASWVQLSVSAGSGWPHNALRHHWLMPISCHFRYNKCPDLYIYLYVFYPKLACRQLTWQFPTWWSPDLALRQPWQFDLSKFAYTCNIMNILWRLIIRQLRIVHFNSKNAKSIPNSKKTGHVIQTNRHRFVSNLLYFDKYLP